MDVATPDQIHDLFEQAVASCGWHTSRGSEIWDAYINYETDLLEDSSAGSEEHQVIKEKIRQLYIRQLSAPLIGMDSVMSKVLNWLRAQPEYSGDGLSPEVFRVYGICKAELDLLQPFEHTLSQLPDPTSPGQASPELLQAWQTYLTDLLSRCAKERPTQCLVVFERVVAQCFLNPDIWLRYLSFLQTSLAEHSDLIGSVFTRALRNCPWSGLILERHLRFLDADTGERQEVSTLMEKTEAGLKSVGQADERVYVWLASGSIVRRVARVGQPGDVPDSKNALPHLAVLKTICATLERELYGCYYDDSYHAAITFLCHILGTCLGNSEKVKDLCERWVGAKPKDQRAWSFYITFMRTQPRHLSLVRKLFKRAWEAVPADWSKQILAREWLGFERQEGEPKDLQIALTKCEPLLGFAGAGLTSMLHPAPGQPLNTAGDSEEDEEDYSYAQAAQSRKSFRDKREKRGGEKDQKKKDKKKGGKAGDKKDKKRKRDQTADAQGEGENKTGETGAGGPPKKQLKTDNSENKSGGIEGGKSTSYGVEGKEEKNTVFVLNLPWNVTDNNLKSVFGKIGPLEGIRHVRNYKGFSKGYAYVDYLDPQHVSKAIAALNGTEIKGRVVSVSISKPGSNKNKGLDGKSIFIKNIPQITQQELEPLLRSKFETCGEIKEIRWARDHSGKLKRFCYLEFVAEEAVAPALLLHGCSLGRSLKAGEAEGLETTSILMVAEVKSKDQMKKPTKNLEKAIMKKTARRVKSSKSHLSLMVPRAVALQRQAAAKAQEQGSEAESEEEEESKPAAPTKSNADFRAMFLKK